MLRGTDITSGQDELLIGLKYGRLSVRDLAEKLGVRPSTISKMVARMVPAGLIARSKDQVDERLVMLSLTEKGQVAALRIEAVHQAFAGELNRLLGKDAKQTMSTLSCLDAVLAKRLLRLR